jgi:leucyl-tRNA synthetase
VVAPDELVARYGADTVRAYLMFFARWDMGAPWNSSGIEGAARWVRRLWVLFAEPPKQGMPSEDLLKHLRRKVHQTLERVTHDYDEFEFNTIISSLMELLNEMYKAVDGGAAGSKEWDEAVGIYLRMMAPAVPHVAEELWARSGKPYSIHQQPWPKVDLKAIVEEFITLVIQVNGKIRDKINVPINYDESQVKEAALSCEPVQRHLAGQAPKKVIVVPGKLINIVV